MEDDGESLEETGENVKNFFVYKLNFESVPEIEHAHFTGCPRRQDGTPKPRAVVCKFIGYKVKDSILKTARRIKPEGIHIFEDLAEETMERRIAQLLVLCCCVYPCKV